MSQKTKHSPELLTVGTLFNNLYYSAQEVIVELEKQCDHNGSPNFLTVPKTNIGIVYSEPHSNRNGNSIDVKVGYEVPERHHLFIALFAINSLRNREGTEVKPLAISACRRDEIMHDFELSKNLVTSDIRYRIGVAGVLGARSQPPRVDSSVPSAALLNSLDTYTLANLTEIQERTFASINAACSIAKGNDPLKVFQELGRNLQV